MATDHGSQDFVSRGPAVLAVTATFLVVATVFVFLRLVSRFGIVRRPGWDDYTIIVAWLLAFGTSFAICYGTSVGLGRHEVDIPAAWSPALKKAEYTFSVLYNPTLMVTKTSILLFYLSLPKIQKVFRWGTIATLILVNSGGLALTFVNIFQCRPVSAAFQTPVPQSAKCIDIVTVYLSSAPLNIITDLAILFLPMPILTGMRLPGKQKTILVITFGFGVFVAAVDVVRIAYLQAAARTQLQDVQQHKNSGIDSRNVDDFSWYASFSFMWSAIEINVGVMCACVPALKPLVSRFLPHWIQDATVRNRSVATNNSNKTQPDLGMHIHAPSPVSPRVPPPALSLNFAARSSTNVNQSPPRSPHSNGPSTAYDFGWVSPRETPLSQPMEPRTRDSDGAMDMMAFLATPNVNEMPNLNRADTFATHSTGRHRPPTFFDFVDIRGKKNITLMSNRESVYPIVMVTVLFFIWGFAYGLLDTLNAQFQEVAHMTTSQTIGIHSAYYCGYITGPLTFGRIVLKRWGFKACYTVGLLIYACGTLVFWPSAVLTSFPAFLISNFIAGCGLSTLEISANPYIALCGPPEYAELRLNLSQAVQAIGSILSPLLARKVLFKVDTDSLIDAQWAYLGISFFTVILAVIYYYVPLPGATNEELEAASERLPIPREATFLRSNVKVIWITLGLGVLSQFCYVGAQEAVSTSFGNLTQRVMPSLNPANHQNVGRTAFAVGRFFAAFVNIWIKPRFLLLFFYIGTIACAASLISGSGAAPAALIVMLLFFEGPIFSLIYAQSLRGLGKHTKDAAALLTATIGGGAVIPPIMYAANDARNVQFGFCVVLVAYSLGMLFPIWTNSYPAARELADPVRDEQTRRESEIEEEENRRDSLLSGDDRKKKRFSASRFRKRFSRKEDDLPIVEHKERRSWPEGATPSDHSPGDG